MKEFFEAFNGAGNIPVELVRWEMINKENTKGEKNARINY